MSSFVRWLTTGIVPMSVCCTGTAAHGTAPDTINSKNLCAKKYESRRVACKLYWSP